MDVYTEASYENSVIALFEGMGYTHVYGPDVVRDYRSPLYDDELKASLRRINPRLPQDAIDEAYRKLTNFDNGALVRKNRAFTDWMQNGLEVQYAESDGPRSALVRLVDYSDPDGNSFIVANQWTFIENGNRRPDMLVFLNGLPVVLIELKSPSREETDAGEAYVQIRNYMQDIPSMFIYNAICVMSDQLTSKAGTITSGEARFMEWKTKDGCYENTRHAAFDTFFEGIFPKERFLDILKNFICYVDDGPRTYKVLAGYHQYFAVRKAIASTRKAMAERTGKGGVFWHTQGSGKSLSMVFYAHLLQEALNSPTIVVITDRNDLDDQLFGQFAKCAFFLRQRPEQARDRRNLRELLADRKANGIIFSTMQKFESEDDALTDRTNVVVMADEAHRGQYGLRERVRISKDELDRPVSKIVQGIARIIRKSLPKATYIGFTGTPVSVQDRNTREVFGDYIDVYDMTQAVEDGATRPVYYESRVLKLNLKPETLKRIDDSYDELAEDTDPENIEKSKHDLATMDELLGNDETVGTLVDDILKHYEGCRERLLTGKAMIVAYSRPVALKIYGQILKARPGWEKKVAVVMTGSNKDPEEWHDLIGGKAHRDELAKEFKDDGSPLKIAIVVDMWLTGFDVPSLATMYVFKPMKGHNLMQAIARVNRVYKDKEGGLVVDYVGIMSALKRAMADYSARDRKKYGDMDVSGKAYEKFREKLEVCRDQFHGYDRSAFFGEDDLVRARCISGAVNFILDKEKAAENEIFVKEARLMTQALTLCASIVEEKERVEAAFFEAVRVLLQRLKWKGDGKIYSVKDVNERIGALLKECVGSDGVKNLFDGVKEKFSIFDEKFLNDVSKMEHRNIAIEILKDLIKEQIRSYRGRNVVNSAKFSELMSGIVRRYLNGLLTNEEVIDELLKLAKSIQEERTRGKDLGLTEEETAFYDALAKPQAVKDAYSSTELAGIAKELTDILRKNRTIDWQQRKAARAKMRMLVRRLLREYKYPPEGKEEAVETVLAQCEAWTDNTA